MVQKFLEICQDTKNGLLEKKFEAEILSLPLEFLEILLKRFIPQLPLSLWNINKIKYKPVLAPLLVSLLQMLCIWLVGKLTQFDLSIIGIGFSLPIDELKNSFEFCLFLFLLKFDWYKAAAAALACISANICLVNIFNDWLRLVFIDSFLIFLSLPYRLLEVAFFAVSIKTGSSRWLVACMISDWENRFAFRLERANFNGGRL